MPKFMERAGGADLLTNPYYNDVKWCCTRGYKLLGSAFQCTDWAFLRTQEIAECRCTYLWRQGEKADICTNPIFPNGGYPAAKYWYANSVWPKSVDNPRVGDIVCYGSSWGAGHGHVRIIERIENNYMYLSGGNENYKGGAKFGIKAPITIGGGVNSVGLQGYIHNPFITNDNPVEEPDYKALYLETKTKLDQIRKILEV